MIAVIYWEMSGGEGAAMGKRISVVRIASAVGLICFLGTAAIVAFRPFDDSKPTAPTRKVVAPRSPTHLPGPYYSEALVTEYYEDYSTYPLPLGFFTVVEDGVEYRVRESYGALPIPIKPGYYQVLIDNGKAGLVTVILGDQGDVYAVSGFVVSERLTEPLK
jgi:hypothetical protein